MATTSKTVKFNFTTLASAVNNTLTAITPMTIYLPETNKVFKKVWAYITWDDIVTATGGTYTSRRLDLQLGAIAASSVNNTQTYTNSGENVSSGFSADYTSYFTTNWSGTSMTVSPSVLLNQSTGTTLGVVNVSVTLYVTYECDTGGTQVKTVYIPLNAPVTTLGSAKPAAIDTIPALDTELPEASKAIRNVAIVTNVNINLNAAVIDNTMSFEIDTLGVTTTGNYEASLATDRTVRYVWNVTGAFTTNATHSFYIWSSVAARCYHPQIWMEVTYEYDESTTTSVFNSLMIPMKVGSPIGGTTSSDFQRSSIDLWIEEPTTITTKNLAFFGNFYTNGVVTGLNCRIGTGSFVAYTDVATLYAGTNPLMVRNDAAFTLARGKNTVSFDAYRTSGSSATSGWGFTGFWILNYTSAKATAGTHVHNKTLIFPLYILGTAAATSGSVISAVAPVIPETEYFLNATGIEWQLLGESTSGTGAQNISVERLSAEGGVRWEEVLNGYGVGDNEIGFYYMYDNFDLFKVTPSEVSVSTKFDIETARRWRMQFLNFSTYVNFCSLIYSYHSIATTLSGTISSSGGGTVTIKALRLSDLKVIAETTRTGDGAYSMTVYDSVNNIIVVAYESDTLKGASKQDPAGSSFDIALASSGGGTTGFAYIS
jgi:hypothetical protein